MERYYPAYVGRIIQYLSLIPRSIYSVPAMDCVYVSVLALELGLKRII